MSAEVICISSDEDELDAQESDGKSKDAMKPKEATSKRKQVSPPTPLTCPPAKREKLDEPTPKPSLIIKEKRSVSPVDNHPFPMFVDLCLQKDRADDMQNIVNKLKRAFDRLDDEYRRSEAFKYFLNEKREAMTNDKKNKYIYILDVVNEMKARVRGSSSLLSRPEVAEEENNEEEQRKSSKIARIDKAMRKCEKYIKKFESAEVDFDDEDDSTYIKLERYKRRMVELYNARCRLIGESADAGRSYLRPRRLKPTGISPIDEAITKLVNTKIEKRNKLKNVRSAVDSFVFPNYPDILECIRKCNEGQSLGYSSGRVENIAKTAFTQLGEHLQRVRRNDYWDTFSLYLEKQEEDPASQDALLAAKLAESQREGQKRLANVLQKYVDEQEKQTEKEASADSEEEEEEEEEEDTCAEEEEESDKETVSENGQGTVSPARASPEERISVDAESRDPRDNLASCDTQVSPAVPLGSPTASESGTEEEVTQAIESDLSDRLTSIESLAEDCDFADDANPPTKEDKPILRLRSFAKPPTTWDDFENHKSPDLVDLTQTPPTATRAKSICIVKPINNNNNNEPNKRIKVIQPVTVLNQVLATNGTSVRVAKALAAGRVIKVLRNQPGNCVAKRIQSPASNPTTSAGRTK